MKKSIIIFSIMFSLCPLVRASMGSSELKDTYNVLTKEYKHLSPIHGALSWELGVLRNYYKFGNYDNPQYVVNEDKKTGEIKKVFTFETNRMMTFLRFLFHEVGGVPNIVDTHTNNIAPQLTLKTLGKILGTIERHRKNPSTGKPKKGDISSLRSELKGLILDSDNNVITKSFKFSGNYDLVPGAKANPKKIKENFNNFSAALEGGLKLDGTITEGEPRYLPFTAYTFFLAYVYRRADSKNDLIDFFIGLGEGLGASPVELVGRRPDPDSIEQQVKDALSDSWLTSRFKKVQPSFTELQTILTPLNEDTVDPQSFDTAFDALSASFEDYVAYALSLKTAMPQDIVYANVQYEGKNFANCVETMMRKIFNLIVYDSDSRKYEVSKFGEHADEKLKSFYTKHSDDAGADKQETHQAWIYDVVEDQSVVENRPWVAYVNCLDITTKKIVTLPGLLRPRFITIQNPDKSFITTQEGLKKIFPQDTIYEEYQGDAATFPSIKINNRIYAVNPDPARYHLYEVDSLARNVVILLNDLLGLGIVPVDHRARGFARDRFVEDAFDAICRQLNWSKDESLKTVEDSDSDKGAVVSIQLPEGEQFKLYIDPYHSECSYQREAIGDFQKDFFKILIQAITQKGPSNLELLLKGLVEIQQSFSDLNLDTINNRPYAEGILQELLFSGDIYKTQYSLLVVISYFKSLLKLQSLADFESNIVLKVLDLMPRGDDFLYEEYAFAFLDSKELRNNALFQYKREQVYNFLYEALVCDDEPRVQSARFAFRKLFNAGRLYDRAFDDSTKIFFKNQKELFLVNLRASPFSNSKENIESVIEWVKKNKPQDALIVLGVFIERIVFHNLFPANYEMIKSTVLTAIDTEGFDDWDILWSLIDYITRYFSSREIAYSAIALDCFKAVEAIDNKNAQHKAFLDKLIRLITDHLGKALRDKQKITMQELSDWVDRYYLDRSSELSRYFTVQFIYLNELLETNYTTKNFWRLVVLLSDLPAKDRTGDAVVKRINKACEIIAQGQEYDATIKAAFQKIKDNPKNNLDSQLQVVFEHFWNKPDNISVMGQLKADSPVLLQVEHAGTRAYVPAKIAEKKDSALSVEYNPANKPAIAEHSVVHLKQIAIA